MKNMISCETSFQLRERLSKDVWFLSFIFERLSFFVLCDLSNAKLAYITIY